MGFFNTKSVKYLSSLNGVQTKVFNKSLGVIGRFESFQA